MRLTNTNDGLKVHAIAGTYDVLLGFDLRRLIVTGCWVLPSTAPIILKGKPIT